jgi:predicted nucleic acid-binding protein
VAVAGWLVDRSAAVRATQPVIARQLVELAGSVYVGPMGELEQLHSARSASDYDALRAKTRDWLRVVPAPADVLDRALALQRDLAHHHGLWHRIPIPDLVIAETAVHHGFGVLHVDGNFERIAEVRPLITRRLG